MNELACKVYKKYSFFDFVENDETARPATALSGCLPVLSATLESMSFSTSVYQI